MIYLGYHRSVRDIVRAAIQEDVQAIGISSYNGGHIEFFTEVLKLLKLKGARHIHVFGGGGGTITPADARELKQRGVDEIFSAGTPLQDMVEFVESNYSRPFAKATRPPINSWLSDLEISRLLTAAGNSGLFKVRMVASQTRVIGITGPGGAGKTTLIDELTLRFLEGKPQGRLAILSHDPSLHGRGALLGDRATMVYAQHDRVFMRSLATRGSAGGLSRATKGCVQVLKQAGFDLVLVESAGIGQENLPFARGLVDMQVLVMSPDYGSRLQLQKIAMLEAADVVVINKTDMPAARTAFAELEQRVALNRKQPVLIATTAKQHKDPGVSELFRLLNA